MSAPMRSEAGSTEKEKSGLDDLPADPLLHILSYLDYKDLLSCCLCQRLKELAYHDSHWKVQCVKYWKQTECPAGLTWRKFFIQWYKDFGRYTQCYRKIRKAWDQIETYMSKNCPEIFGSLQAGLSDGELDSIERQLHSKLPLELRCAYRIHNGQVRGYSAGLMGSIMVYNHYRTEYLEDLNMALARVKELESVGLPQCLPLTDCSRSDVFQSMSLSSENGFACEQIFYPNIDRLSPQMSWDAFISGNSFEEWFTSYAQSLENEEFPVKSKEVLRVYNEPSCVAKTGNIDVRVYTAFCPEQSSIHPPFFFHTYYILMSMSPDAPKSETCRLETRHWIITDDENHEERVDGPGVIGKYPLMKPGAVFAYASCTNFHTTYGNMRGSFTFKNLQTGEDVEVICPTFYMKCYPFQTSEETRQQALAAKKNN